MLELGLRVLVTLNMLKAHTADNTSSILDDRHAVSIVWVLALGNQIANGYSIGDRTRTVNECFETVSDFYHHGRWRVHPSKHIQMIEQSLH